MRGIVSGRNPTFFEDRASDPDVAADVAIGALYVPTFPEYTAEILDVMFSAQPRKGIIATALDAGEKVTIPGFGTFATKSRGERQGRNPATGATITIPAKKYVHFKPGKTLRERVEK